jgi:hypothetical protein
LFASAHLGLARAYVMQSDTTKARAACDDSLRCGKTPTPAFPFSALPDLNTQDRNSYR